ncbi:phage holin family protein [Nitrosomonas sp.]|uniref:phage holin family protein n=1 Tax=Nitrosomonas sp. TaxID=42353 RepID=UPI0037C8D9A9
MLALQELVQAQRQLFTAEWQLARSITVAAFLCAALAAFFALALSLSVTMLAALLLAKWLGSWTLSLVVLVIILALCLVSVLYGLRYCLHRMSLPETRAQLHRTIAGLASTPTNRSRTRSKATNDGTFQKPE